MIEELNALVKEEKKISKRLDELQKEYPIKIRKQMDKLISTQERLAYLNREIENN
jgi:flagellar hook-associated protein FlgK